jgi:hypothetical protein
MKRLFANLAATLFLAGLLLLSSGAANAQEMTFSDLARKLPGSINAVMAVNVGRIAKSEIATREGWASTYAGQTASGLMFVPEKANVVLVGATMDIAAFHPRETALLITMDQVPPFDTIRGLTNGEVDEVGDRKFIETTSGGYVYRVSDHLVAGLRPAQRPYFLNWINDMDRDTTRVPDYLEEGISYSDKLGTEIIMAFNLDGTVSRSRVYDKIRDMPAISNNSLNAKEVSGQIASMRGITIGVTVRDKVYGAVKIDFAEDISSLDPLASQIAQSVFSRTGLTLEEFQSWPVKASKNSIELSGDLSTPSLRKLLSIVNVPSFTDHPYASVSESEQSPDTNTPAYISKRYFDTVNSFYDEIKAKITPGAAYLENAKWLGTYADKISALSVLNVDDAVVTYGDEVAQTLRDAAVGLRDSNQTTKVNEQQLIASGTRSGGGYGANLSWGGGFSSGGVGWGEGNRGDGSRIRRATRNQEQSEAITSVVSMFSKVDTDRVQVQQAMTRKYGMDF